MNGQMMDLPLTLEHFLARAEGLFGAKQIVTATPQGLRRQTYAEWGRRVRCVGGVLDALGVREGGRVGSFGWNTDRHLELYFGVPCSGRVLHTVNVRLSDDELEYVVTHAEDEVLFVDRSLAGRILDFLPRLPTVRAVVLLDDGTPDPGLDALDYERLLSEATEQEPAICDENSAAAMCYTSGTTGRPKGVVYSHRSIYLHTFGILARDGLAISETDVVMPVVPMFHAAAWGLPFAAVAAGSKLVLPGRDLSPEALVGLIEGERVTFSAGVPTVWTAVPDHAAGRDLSSLRTVMSGGSAVPRALSERFRDVVGLPILHVWGMTEVSPIGSVCHVRSDLDGLTEDELADLNTSIGMPIAGVDARIVGDDDDVLPWDGTASGEFQVRGPWVTGGYHGGDGAESFTEDGWFRTGDVATIDSLGYVRLVDRTKDLVKSGGEWISSVRLENEIMGHPSVLEAAVIAIPDAKWQERPLACVVARAGETLTEDDVLGFLGERVPRWWIPDRVLFLDELPKTSTGKFAKRRLRELYATPEATT